MYIEVTSKQLKEYNKLLSTLESVETQEQYDTYTNMLKNFGNLCDYRIDRLKKYTIKQCLLFNYSAVKYYKKYKEATLEQVDNLMLYSNEWLSQYDEWVKQQNERETRMVINGFSKLLKKKRRYNG